VAPALVLVLLVVGAVWGGNWWVKTMLGEVYYRDSLVSASKNDGSGTYNWQIKAIAINENSPEYRRRILKQTWPWHYRYCKIKILLKKISKKL